MSSPSRFLASCLTVLLLGIGTVTAHAQVVISQFYTPGGGGGGGGGFEHSYIELHNNGLTPVSLDGWSIQYAEQGGSWGMTPLTGSIAPGGYYLIWQGNSGGGAPLPPPDAVGASFMVPAGGKIALVSSTQQANGCANGVPLVDFVGYGGLGCFEGSAAAPAMDPVTANFRLNQGCQDTNDNSVDFHLASPAPRNSASPAYSCASPPSGTAQATPMVLVAGRTTLFTVSVTPGTTPPSTGITVVGDLSAIGGGAAETLYDDGTHGDVMPGDNVYSLSFVVDAGTVPSNYLVDFTVADAQGRSSIATAVLFVNGRIVISQIYTPGGGGGAYDHAFVELHNNGGVVVVLDGWSLQYQEPGGPLYSTPLSGSIAPGAYYLVQQGNSGPGSPLPPPDAIGTAFLFPAAGKLALLATEAQFAGCGGTVHLVDLVGYGSIGCFEGAGTAPVLGPSTALFRKDGGCQDTDNNAGDFTLGTPAPRNTSSPADPCVSVPPMAAGAANPVTVQAGSQTLLTVTVTPAKHPTSDSHSVPVDLGALGLGTQDMLDNGSGGDVTAGDLVHSYQLTVPANATPGLKQLPVTACDALGRCGADTIVIEVQSTAAVGDPAPVSFALHGAVPNPAAGEFGLAFTLPTAAPARITLLDVGGRSVASHEVGRLGAGRHVLRVGAGARLAPGVYLARLTQGSRSATTRVVVTR